MVSLSAQVPRLAIPYQLKCYSKNTDGSVTNAFYLTLQQVTTTVPHHSKPEIDLTMTHYSVDSCPVVLVIQEIMKGG